MLRFTTEIQKFGRQGEKTGWTYIFIPAAMAQQLNPGCKQSFRVKGTLDEVAIAGVALVPMGEGDFIMALKADLRRALKKQHGHLLEVAITLDKAPYQINRNFLDCLEDEPAAAHFFKTLTGGHQRYFSKWIESAKTTPTQEKRIAMAVSALAKGWGYPEMIRANQTKSL